MILDSGAKKLLVTCPICYKVFKEDYHLPNIEVVHHSEYILDLVKNGRLKVNPSEIRAVYHDPCELGRGSHIYEQPRELLASTLTLVPMDREREKALCCGGSLANTKISMAERDILSGKAMEEFASYNPDVVVTSCPLCKKTFSKVNSVPVKDLAEVVVNSMKQE